jgi:hypothetical protein
LIHAFLSRIHRLLSIHLLRLRFARFSHDPNQALALFSNRKLWDHHFHLFARPEVLHRCSRACLRSPQINVVFFPLPQMGFRLSEISGERCDEAA